MSRGAQTFKQGELTKAVKGLEKAGVKVGRVEIVRGRIIVFAGEPETIGPKNDVNEWDAE